MANAMVSSIRRTLIPLLTSSSIFLAIDILISFPQKYAISEFKGIGAGWNWAWPATLFLISWLAAKWAKIATSDRHLRLGLVFLVAYLTVIFGYCIFIGLPMRKLFGALVLGTLFFQLTVSVAEELFYRRFGIEYISQHEGKSRPWVAYIATSLIFGLGHGLNPVLKGTGGFDFAWFLSTFASAIIFGVIYLRTKSYVLSGLAHFSLNTVGIFFMPWEKVVHDLSLFGALKP